VLKERCMRIGMAKLINLAANLLTWLSKTFLEVLAIQLRPLSRLNAPTTPKAVGTSSRLADGRLWI
jgi:hypothetical protein